MSETATEAAARAVAPLIQQIADGSGLLPAEHLPIGCAVKVSGEWFGFQGLDLQGRMMLTDGNCRDPHIYGPTVAADGSPERFVWASPF